MTERPSDADGTEPGVSRGSDRLMVGWERGLACLLGLAIAGAGGIAVFLSSNQAGTTALILIGAIFLLIGVQGTPIARASKDSIELRARELVRKAKEIATEGRAENAERFIEGAIAAEPRLSRDENLGQVGRELFTLGVRHAIENLALARSFYVTTESSDYALNMQLRSPRKPGDFSFGKVFCDVFVFYAINDIRITHAVKNYFRAGVVVPRLLVSNRDMPNYLRERYRDILGRDAHFFVWRDDFDIDALADVIDKVRALSAET